MNAWSGTCIRSMPRQDAPANAEQLRGEAAPAASPYSLPRDKPDKMQKRPQLPSFRLDRRLAVITGASRGIGAALASAWFDISTRATSFASQAMPPLMIGAATERLSILALHGRKHRSGDDHLQCSEGFHSQLDVCAFYRMGSDGNKSERPRTDEHNSRAYRKRDAEGSTACGKDEGTSDRGALPYRKI